jgi:hypothetical protein
VLTGARKSSAARQIRSLRCQQPVAYDAVRSGMHMPMITSARICLGNERGTGQRKSVDQWFSRPVVQSTSGFIQPGDDDVTPRATLEPT